MRLIIAEKPALARQIINAIRKANLQDFEVVALSGHILEYIEPKDQNDKWAKWTIESLPIIDLNWKMKVKSDKKDIYNHIKSAIQNADEVVNAGDMDSEGQLLVDEVIKQLGFTKPVYRLNTADTTENSLINSLRNLEPNEKYKGLSNSALARSLSDMTYGFTASRAFTLVNGKKVNIGRVSSNVINLVSQRDNDINNFESKDYSTIFAKASNSQDTNSCTTCIFIPSDSTYLDKYGYLSEPSKIEEIKSFLNNSQYQGEVKERDFTSTPPLPYNLLTLQKDCQKYNILADEVMSITQSLRDNYNAITYNRTEHSELPESYYDNRASHIQRVLQNLNDPTLQFREEPNYKSKCFITSSEVKEHFGIIPQEVEVNINKLTDRERLVYTLICKRYLMQFMGDKVDLRRTLTINLPNNLIAKATGSINKVPGWSLIYEEVEDDTEEEVKEEFVNVPFSINDKEFILSEPFEKKSKTKPPKRYSIASLLTQLKKDDLGTPATRDKIINNQINNGYLFKNGKFLEATALGLDYLNVVPTELRTPETTKKWKEIRAKIESGEGKVEDLLDYVVSTLEPYYKGKESKSSYNRLGFFENEKSHYYRVSDTEVRTISRSNTMFRSLTRKQMETLLSTGKLSKAKFTNKEGKLYRVKNIKVEEWVPSNNNKTFIYPKIKFDLDFETK